MDNYHNFLQSQNQIYKEFEEIDLNRTGIRPKESKGAVGLVYLKYPEEVTVKLAEISRKIGNTISGFTYSAEDFHTTIVPLNVDEPDLKEIELEVSSSSKDLSVSFGKILSNSDSVILSGTPSLSLYEVYLDLYRQMNNKSYAQRTMSMNHLTLFRYGEAMKPDSGKLKELNKVLNELSVEMRGLKIRPVGISIGWYNRKNKERLKVIKSFRI